MRLAKTEEPRVFLNIVEKYAREAFAPQDFVKRISDIIDKEAGRSIGRRDLEKKIASVAKQKSLHVDTVGSKFGLESASKAAQLITTLIKVYLSLHGSPHEIPH